MATDKKISLIITTYNWPQALDLVLRSLEKQQDENFEVIIADDGSKADTAWKSRALSFCAGDIRTCVLI
ncbi:glycosyltransferase [Kiloniella laminariae]|uniref:Glycosyltransferase n=1 Tax=Kiloniella laminariae TaxID=454162 RepID=A0ABT4LJG6_9PROT|nr:glycosyltransferase [Kiloniella laminariae]MCZ4281222.1 glycosyltransferase [Kiloniella laminariae]